MLLIAVQVQWLLELRLHCQHLAKQARLDCRANTFFNQFLNSCEQLSSTITIQSAKTARQG